MGKILILAVSATPVDKEIFVKFTEKFRDFFRRWEGWEITDDPDDPGGFTAFGISRKYHPSARIFKLIDSGVKDVSLLEEAAIEFYTSEIENTKGIKHLPERFHFAFYDFAINAGQDDATLCWQRTVNFFFPNSLKEDGGFGSKTGEITRKYFTALDNPIAFLIYQENRLGIYIDKTAKDGKKLKYLRGWKNRTLDLTKIFL